MSEPGGADGLSRRTFFLRALAGIGGAFAAALAVPVVGFGSAPFWRAKGPPTILSPAVTPALRATGWASAGALEEFTVGEPRLITLTRTVVDGWVKGEAQVACYVLRDTDMHAVAFDHHCTHLGCPLSWSSGAQRFLCPCHGGAFAANGEVVAGPPPHPMVTYQTKVEQGQIMVGELGDGA